MTAYDGWTDADLEEANKVEFKRDALQVLLFSSMILNNLSTIPI